MQRGLFSEAPSSAVPILPEDGEASYYRAFLIATEADELFARLEREVPWRQGRIRMYGVERLMPRLTAWYGDALAQYTYSGLKNDPLPWLPVLAGLRDRLERATGARFNSALLNLYRDGNDSVAWHADDEPELGERPTIASVSLGAERVFELARVADGRRVKCLLEHGSLLVMSGDSQRCWRHRIAKSRAVERSRINLTFREVAARPNAEERAKTDGRSDAR